MDSFQAFELASGLSASAIQKRQTGVLAIPTTYLGLNSGPSPGVLAAIVLGTVGGFLLICYLVWVIATFGGGIFNRRTTVVEEVVEHRSGSSRRRREEDVHVIRERTSTSRRSNYIRETTRGDIEGEDISIP